ncbi:G-protein coupled receptors family 3 profile domain-containing protein [Plasmodiophora brassicae]
MQATKAFFCTALTNDSMDLPPRVPVLIGPSYSSQAIMFAHLANLNGLPMISPTATSPVLSDKSLYGTFSRMFPPDNFQGKALAQTVQYFGWNVVCAISTSDTYGSSLMNVFVREAGTRNITVATAIQFSSAADPTDQLQRILSTGVRVIVMPMLSGDAKTVLTVAAKLGMTTSQYVWLGTDGIAGWMDPSIFEGVLATSGLVDHSTTAYQQMTAQFTANYNSNPGLGHPVLADTGAFLYDAIHFGFYTLYKMDQAGVPWTRTNVLQWIRQTTMNGSTGTIVMDANGDRLGAYSLYNVQKQPDGTLAWVAAATVYQTNIVKTLPFVFSQGRTTVPVAVPIAMSVQLGPSSAAVGAMVSLGGIGIAAALGILAFNVYYRNLRYIKMSTPILNDIIIVGCIVAYICQILLAVSGSITDVKAYADNCTTRIVLLTTSFSLSFGVLFSKTYRVAMIFGSGEMRVVKIKNSQLLSYVIVLLLADFVVLVVWMSTWPITTVVTTLPSYPNPADPSDSLINPFVLSCTSTNMSTFLTTIYVYKGLLVGVGAILALKTSHVNIPALNDSRQIGLAIYTSGLISVIVIPILGFIQPGQPDASLLLGGFAIFLATTATLLILFVPKIVAVFSGIAQQQTETHHTDLQNEPNRTTAGSQESKTSPDGARTPDKYKVAMNTPASNQVAPEPTAAPQ